MIYLGLNERIVLWFKRAITRLRSCDKIKTERGATVVRVGHKFAVKSSFGRYVDLVNSEFSWAGDSRYFRDCVASQNEIESRYGKMIFPIDIDSYDD